ncbi:MAG: hypothetical protein P8170_03545 [Gemmatimonadota bacterium]
MLKTRVPSVVVALLLASAAAPVEAQEDHPIQISLVTPVQIVPEDEAVRGVRLNILYGRNTFMTGFDYGLVNHTMRDFLGVGLGVVNLTEGSATGLQWGGVNVTKGAFEGFQVGWVNTVGSGHGLQLGLVNHAPNYRGLQFGFVNYAERMNGVQVGFVNIIREGGVLPVMPIVNWSLEEGSIPN